LKARGVETNVSHVRNDIYTIFGKQRLELPNMNTIEDKYICLPIHCQLTDTDVEKVVESIKMGW